MKETISFLPPDKILPDKMTRHPTQPNPTRGPTSGRGRAHMAPTGRGEPTSTVPRSTAGDVAAPSGQRPLTVHGSPDGVLVDAAGERPGEASLSLDPVAFLERLGARKRSDRRGRSRAPHVRTGAVVESSWDHFALCDCEAVRCP